MGQIQVVSEKRKKRKFLRRISATQVGSRKSRIAERLQEDLVELAATINGCTLVVMHPADIWRAGINLCGTQEADVYE